jgi:hypothetical protein
MEQSGFEEAARSLAELTTAYAALEGATQQPAQQPRMRPRGLSFLP